MKVYIFGGVAYGWSYNCRILIREDFTHFLQRTKTEEIGNYIKDVIKLCSMKEQQ